MKHHLNRPLTTAIPELTVKPRQEEAEDSPAAEPLRKRVQSLRLPPQMVARRSGWFWIGWLLFLLVLGGGGYLAYRHFHKSDPGEAIVPPAPSTPKTPSLSTASSGAIVLEAQGYVIPTRQILVSPKVSGMILKLNFQEGDRVQKGEALAQIEDIDYRAERDRVQAQLEAAQWALKELQRGFRKQEIEQAKAEREETKAQLRKAEADYKRNAQLFQRNVIPKEDFDETYSQYVALRRRAERLQFAVELMEIGPRQERIEAARAQMKQAQAELRKAQWRLDNCTIRAPISGTILKKNAEEGNIVNPVAFNISFSLCEMANLADMEVELSIQERDVAKVFPKQKCEIRPLAYRQRTYQGYVSRLMPIADRAKGAIPVRVKISIPPEEEGVYLKPEMGALVSFLGKTDDAAPPSESGKTKPQAVSDDNG